MFTASFGEVSQPGLSIMIRAGGCTLLADLPVYLLWGHCATSTATVKPLFALQSLKAAGDTVPPKGGTLASQHWVSTKQTHSGADRGGMTHFAAAMFSVYNFSLHTLCAADAGSSHSAGTIASIASRRTQHQPVTSAIVKVTDCQLELTSCWQRSKESLLCLGFV